MPKDTENTVIQGDGIPDAENNKSIWTWFSPETFRLTSFTLLRYCNMIHLRLLERFIYKLYCVKHVMYVLISRGITSTK